MKELIDLYISRGEAFGQEAEALQKKFERFSLIRLLAFIIGIGLIILVWTNTGWIWGVSAIVLFIAGFGLFMRWHQGLVWKRNHLRRKQQLNRWESQAQEGSFDFFPAGKAFLDLSHPYALDLDIFGNFSLFQYVNRGNTVLGQARLAEFLQTSASAEIITKRQQAARELAEKLEWRQDLQVLGMDAGDVPKHVDLLNRWLSLEDLVLGNERLTMARWVIPLLTLGALVGWILFFPWYVALLFFVPAILLIRNTLERVNKLHVYTAEAGDILKTYGRLIEHMEKEPFEAEGLKELQEAFWVGNTAASQSIRRLSYLISQLNVRYNFFAVFLNLGGLWDLQWMYQLERWRAKERVFLPKWFDALAELEALGSLAALQFNHPDWIYPSIREGNRLEASGMGHPLIQREKRVSNDLHMPTRGHIKLITGSNMAGKSTFLRTVGINIVLALSGAPVCANRLELPVLHVYTSMRTQDALHESTSSFMAELKRLKVIIDAVKMEENIFFLLDEILKGTNSRDRHTGARALIEQLIRYRGGGLVATHDLELADLEAQSDGAVENLCMEVDIREGALDFDYKIRKGVSQSFNASILMRQMGIEIDQT